MAALGCCTGALVDPRPVRAQETAECVYV